MPQLCSSHDLTPVCSSPTTYRITCGDKIVCIRLSGRSQSTGFREATPRAIAAVDAMLAHISSSAWETESDGSPGSSDEGDSLDDELRALQESEQEQAWSQVRAES
eukprot:SAG22_NODE_298_length_12785_cov_5.760129_10_plen_106_part_00